MNKKFNQSDKRPEGTSRRTERYDHDDYEAYDLAGRAGNVQGQTNKFTPFPDLIALPAEQQQQSSSSTSSLSSRLSEVNFFASGRQPPDISNVPGRPKSSFINIDSLNAPSSSSASSSSPSLIGAEGILLAPSFSSSSGGGAAAAIGFAGSSSGAQPLNVDEIIMSNQSHTYGNPGGSSRNHLDSMNAFQSVTQAISSLQTSIDQISRTFDHRLSQLENKLDNVTSEMRRVRSDRADPTDHLVPEVNAVEIIREELQNFDRSQRQTFDTQKREMLRMFSDVFRNASDQLAQNDQE